MTRWNQPRRVFNVMGCGETSANGESMWSLLCVITVFEPNVTINVEAVSCFGDDLIVFWRRGC
jgi:hypothetical protein